MSVLADTSVTAGQPQVKTIVFGGELGRRFGRIHRFACDTPAAGLRALCVLIDGLETFLRESPLRYKVFIDHRGVRDAENELQMHHRADRYAVMPVIAGSKDAGLTQILMGAVLIALSFTPAGFMTTPLMGSQMTLGGILLGTGIGMVLGGAVALLMGTRTPTVRESDSKNDPSYFVNGAVNTSSPGQCVPVGYGEFMAGSAVISVDISTIDIAVS